MYFGEWIRKQGYSISSVARRLGVSRASLHSIIDGTSSPRLETAYKIILFTRNEVTIEDLIMASQHIKRAPSAPPPAQPVPLDVPQELLEWESKIRGD